jgi:hypothetical protein
LKKIEIKKALTMYTNSIYIKFREIKMTSTYSEAFMPQHFGHSSTFSVGPAHSYPMEFSFNFYLKHFRSSVVDYILEETGYSELIEYETLCRKTDLFPVYISTNGLLCCDYPIVDETKNKVFALSLHHVRSEVRDWIMEHYIGMNITDYELQYSQYNSIYVVVPHKMLPK